KPDQRAYIQHFFGLKIRAVHHGENDALGYRYAERIEHDGDASIYFMQVLILRINILPSGRESEGFTARQ
ncbi:hypothetical protein LAN33_25435, partial [Mycobacterium tuberculosis]|nr:hypothetical protein [Mycobacterium tuberculosis]